MSEAYRIRDPFATYYLTLQIVDWVDIFTRQIYRDIVVESMQYCRQHKALRVYAYVVMSNHVHLIARAENGNLSDIVRDLKKYTAINILKPITAGTESRKEWILNRFSFAARKHVRNSTYQVWTHENHAVELFGPEFTQQKIDLGLSLTRNIVNKLRHDKQKRICRVSVEYRYQLHLYQHG